MPLLNLTIKRTYHVMDIKMLPTRTTYLGHFIRIFLYDFRIYGD